MEDFHCASVRTAAPRCNACCYTENVEDALVHYEVEPNYAGWTLAAYVAEKLKRPLPGDRLERMLRSRALVHAEPELLPSTLIWPGCCTGVKSCAWAASEKS